MCRLVWNGVGWAEETNTCGPGSVCTVPARDGAYIGEEVDTLCLHVNQGTGVIGSGGVD